MMKPERFNLRIIDNNNIGKSEIEIIDTGNTIQLDFYYKNIFISETDEFPFIALNKIRLQLEKLELKLICEGCRINVRPVSIYLYAYELELSKPATTSVYMFDDTEHIEKIVTVKEQEEFYDKWLKSVGYSDSQDHIDINDPQNTIGGYWYIVNLGNWEIQSDDFKKGIISSIERELSEINKSGFIDLPALKEKFENKLNITLSIE